MELQTEIRNGDDFLATLYAQGYEYNCIYVSAIDNSIRSQILTNNYSDLQDWLLEHQVGERVLLTERKKYKNGFFVEMKLLDWVNLLQGCYDYFDFESQEHIDAVFQM